MLIEDYLVFNCSGRMKELKLDSLILIMIIKSLARQVKCWFV